MNWLKGTHSLSLGGSFTQANIWLTNQTLVPEVDFGIVPRRSGATRCSRPRTSRARRPPISRARRTSTRVLTGRVASVTGNARIDEDTGQYTYLGPATQRARMRDFGFFLQDQWRMRPNLTSTPACATSCSCRSRAQQQLRDGDDGRRLRRVGRRRSVRACNLFQPGTHARQEAAVHQPRQRACSVYDTDWNNFAPSVGFNWTPSAEGGFCGRLLGDEGDTSISGGFSMALQPQRHVGLHQHLRRQSGRVDRRDPQPGHRQPRHAAAAVPRSRAPRSAGVPGRRRSIR